jgi:hypothetical protein
MSNIGREMAGHEAPRHQFPRGPVETVRFLGLGLHPFDKPRQPLVERNQRRELQAGAKRGQIGISVANVAQPILAADHGRRPHTETVGEKQCDLAHRSGLAGADIQGRSLGAVGCDRQADCSRHVGDVHKIAALFSILVELDGFSQAQLVGEDRENAGVRILQRLAFAIDILKAVDDSRNPQRLGGDTHQVFLRQLGRGIDGGGRGLRRFGCGRRFDRVLTARTPRLPFAPAQHVFAPGRRIDRAATAATVSSLAID